MLSFNRSNLRYDTNDIDHKEALSLRSVIHDRSTEASCDSLAYFEEFAHWTKEKLWRVAKRVTRKSYSFDDLIVIEGQSIDKIYFIASGECRVMKSCPNGGSSFVNVTFLSKLGYFGVLEAIDNQEVRSPSLLSIAVCSPRCEVYELPRKDFHIVVRDPKTLSIMHAKVERWKELISRSKIKSDLDAASQWDSFKRSILKDLVPAVVISKDGDEPIEDSKSEDLPREYETIQGKARHDHKYYLGLMKSGMLSNAEKIDDVMQKNSKTRLRPSWMVWAEHKVDGISSSDEDCDDKNDEEKVLVFRVIISCRSNVCQSLKFDSPLLYSSLSTCPSTPEYHSF